MSDTRTFHWIVLLVEAASLLAGSTATADVVTDWNIKIGRAHV
jgi:hypothetical protein